MEVGWRGGKKGRGMAKDSERVDEGGMVTRYVADDFS
jgi:hypothetical protein